MGGVWGKAGLDLITESKFSCSYSCKHCQSGSIISDHGKILLID